jgi:hypothetical protein
MASELGQLIQEQHAVVRPRHVARHRPVAPADQPCVRYGVVGARPGRVVTKVVRSLVRPATRWMRVVSMPSARVMMVGHRRASIDWPAPGRPRSRRFGSECLYPLHPHLQRSMTCRTTDSGAIVNARRPQAVSLSAISTSPGGSTAGPSTCLDHNADDVTMFGDIDETTARRLSRRETARR